MKGMGEFDVRALDSRTTTVALKGPGRVEYYGQPRVTKRASPLGVVTHLIEAEAVAAQ